MYMLVLLYKGKLYINKLEKQPDKKEIKEKLLNIVKKGNLYDKEQVSSKKIYLNNYGEILKILKKNIGYSCESLDRSQKVYKKIGLYQIEKYKYYNHRSSLEENNLLCIMRIIQKEKNIMRKLIFHNIFYKYLSLNIFLIYENENLAIKLREKLIENIDQIGKNKTYIRIFNPQYYYNLFFTNI